MYATSMLAWYIDVTPSIKPVKSGYCLAISYNLIQPPSLPVPPPELLKPSAARILREALVRWKDNTFRYTVSKVAYHLSHGYDQDSLMRSGLQGVDMKLLNTLKPLAESLDYRLCLANFEMSRS